VPALRGWSHLKFWVAHLLRFRFTQGWVLSSPTLPTTHYSLLTLLNTVEQLPYPRQMMIIVLRNKIQMIHQPHRRLQTGMRNRSTK
jgi:hypothetical protein